MVRRTDFQEDVTLPPGLTIPAIRKSIEYIEREATAFLHLVERPNLKFGDLTRNE